MSEIENEERNKLILQVISTYSPSGEEQAVAQIILDYLNKRKLSPWIDDAGNVMCEYGNGETSVLLCGHMDTVPGKLPVKLENGTVFGRGACDAKGALLSLLFAFENIATGGELTGKAVFAGVTEEERASDGLAELVRRKVRADYAFFGEPGGISKVTVGYRGHVTLRLEIETPEVHASAPKLVTNSAELLYEIYASLKKSLGADKDQGSLDKISVALTEIKSGTAHNVIPGKTNATIDIRVPFQSSTNEVKNVVQEVVSSYSAKTSDARITTTYDEPTEPYRVPMNSPIVRALGRSILRKWTKPQYISKSGTGDMNTYARAFGVDAVTYGPGEAKLSHTSEENVSVKEIIECADVLTGAVKELLSAMNENKKEQEE
jgi:[amino group carrier protein]-lysine/ornithine hydrolase